MCNLCENLLYLSQIFTISGGNYLIVSAIMA